MDTLLTAKKLFSETGLSPAEIARETGLTYITVYKYKQNPSMLERASYKNVCALADLYDKVMK